VRLSLSIMRLLPASKAVEALTVKPHVAAVADELNGLGYRNSSNGCAGVSRSTSCTTRALYKRNRIPESAHLTLTGA
jgi:hypothetical protein